jgi:hypothetical protein
MQFTADCVRFHADANQIIGAEQVKGLLLGQ